MKMKTKKRKKKVAWCCVAKVGQFTKKNQVENVKEIWGRID